MLPTIRKPRVFISSTIRDLRDLRSALRYWLEGSGYDVQLSEYNDFDRRPEDDVFEACFNNVVGSDYYILLIGKERGSWYSEEDRLTVTKQEFRVARQTAQTRPLGIFVFVREEVTTALKQWHDDGRPSSQSAIIGDPEFTSEFLEEIQTPDDATDKAASQWIYRFGDFRDIIDGLRVPLRLDADIESRLLQENLLNELLYNLSLLCTRSPDGDIFPNHLWIGRERADITIRDEEVTGDVWLSTRQAGRLGLIPLGYPGKRLRMAAIEEALRRGLFLTFDIQTSGIAVSEAHQALEALHNDMDSLLAQGEEDFQREVNQEFMMLTRSANSGQLGNGTHVNGLKLTALLALHDKMVNVFNAAVQLIKWLLASAESPAIERKPISPVEGMSEAIEAERVSIQQLRWALTNQVYPFGPQLTPAMRKIASGAEGHHAAWLRELIPTELMSDEQIEELVKKSLDKLVLEPFQSDIDGGTGKQKL